MVETRVFGIGCLRRTTCNVIPCSGGWKLNCPWVRVISLAMQNTRDCKTPEDQAGKN